MARMIRQERIKRRWSCEYVAEQVGVTAEAIRLIETGERNPSYPVLIKLENLFKLTHRELFGAATPQREKEPDGNPTESSQQQDITTRAGFQRPKGTERNGKGDTNAKGELSRKP